MQYTYGFSENRQMKSKQLHYICIHVSPLEYLAFDVFLTYLRKHTIYICFSILLGIFDY